MRRTTLVLLVVLGCVANPSNFKSAETPLVLGGIATQAEEFLCCLGVVLERYPQLATEQYQLRILFKALASPSTAQGSYTCGDSKAIELNQQYQCAARTTEEGESSVAVHEIYHWVQEQTSGNCDAFHDDRTTWGPSGLVVQDSQRAEELCCVH